MRFEPFEQRPAQVEDDGQELAGGQGVDQRTVDVLHVLREDVIEVADGLMEMEPEREADRGHG